MTRDELARALHAVQADGYPVDVSALGAALERKHQQAVTRIEASEAVDRMLADGAPTPPRRARDPYTVETLPLEVLADLAKMNRVAVDVIDPSPGLWGGDPVDGLVTVLYRCSCRVFDDLAAEHTHHALYGPRDEDAGTGPLVLYAD